MLRSAIPKASAYLLAAYAGWFPAGTVFLCVVDPGVGGTRPAIILEADGRWYVGPGNGLFELVQRRAGKTRSWDIDWKPERLSASFHGRDLFAPVAAMLARGEPPPGRPRKDDADRRADWPDDLCEIVYVDHFGNAMTGLRAAMLPPNARLAAAGRVLERARTFSDRPAGRGLLVREFERARRNRRQSGARRPRARSFDRNSGRDRLLNEGGVHHSFELRCANQRNRVPATDRPKPQKRRDKPQATGNKRLAEQIRKILGKHYASKYRVR